MESGDLQLPEGVRIGEVFAGRYRVDAILGYGAMGVVVAARHLLLDQSVAIKFLLAAASERADAVARFVQEARAAARLRNEHVVRVLDVAVHESRLPYIVMEYLEGRDLAACLRSAGPLAVPQAADYLLEACEAIAEAHRLGVIHRDLKPANLFLACREGGRPSIKVLDFGIAKSTGLAARTLDLAPPAPGLAHTETKTILGSPLYMSPEQMESAGDVDERTDVWALGVTLFELVTGRVPYPGTTIMQVYSKILSRRQAWHAPLAKHPRDLDAVITRCLERDRGNRFSTVNELAAALAPFGSRVAIASPARVGCVQVTEIDRDAVVNVVTPRPETLASGGADKTQVSPTSAPVQPQRWPRRVIGVGVALAVASAFVGGVASGPFRHPRDAEARTSRMPPGIMAPSPPAPATAPVMVAPAPVVTSATSTPAASTASRQVVVRAASPSPATSFSPSTEASSRAPAPVHEAPPASALPRSSPGAPSPAASVRWDVKRLLEPRE